MAWLLSFWAHAKAWATAALAAVVAASAAYLLGRRKGAAEATATVQLQQRAELAESNAAAAEAAAKHAEVRHEIEAETSVLSDPGPQRVGDASPDSAAGRLRDDGWTS
jgi:hypothetical protein